MKKVLFLFMVLMFAFAFACKKAPPPPPPAPPPPPPPKTEFVAFIQHIGDLPEVKNMEDGKTVQIPLSPEKINSPPAEYAVVEKFKSEWTYDEMSELLKHGELTVIWPAERPSLMVAFGDDLVIYKSVYMKYPDSKFLVLDPKPDLIVKVGEKTYWVTKEGNLWKTW
jgi:hypothetical protein